MDRARESTDESTHRLTWYYSLTGGFYRRSQYCQISQGNRMNCSLSPAIGAEAWDEGDSPCPDQPYPYRRRPLTLPLSPQAGRGNRSATLMRLPCQITLDVIWLAGFEAEPTPPDFSSVSPSLPRPAARNSTPPLPLSRFRRMLPPCTSARRFSPALGTVWNSRHKSRDQYGRAFPADRVRQVREQAAKLWRNPAPEINSQIPPAKPGA